ncbi:MAG: hypothetical protein KAJ75_07765, partial [Alphaproteobacteria bacterium]|nr:hypothetical protein [Alphaproteobacteria bacterium]
KRNPINKNDIPDIKEKFKTKAESKKSFSVSIEKLKEEEYSLLPSRYKEIEYIPKIFKYTPKEMVQNLIKDEQKILALLKKLEEDL